MTAIPPAPAELTTGEARLVNLFQFQRMHPFVLSDGRRFRSLQVAADSVRWMARVTTVIDENTGHMYTWADCCRMVHGVAA